jgi:hypothetical protein
MLDSCKVKLARNAISVLKTKRPLNSRFIYRHLVVLTTAVAGCSISFDQSHLVAYADHCPIEVGATSQNLPINRDLNILHELLAYLELFNRKLSNILVLLLRSIFLLINFTPAVAAAPLLIFGDESSSVWWNIMRNSIRRSGPCTTKFAQWLATRPDLFPLSLCENLQVYKMER